MEVASYTLFQTPGHKETETSRHPYNKKALSEAVARFPFCFANRLSSLFLLYYPRAFVLQIAFPGQWTLPREKGIV